MTRPRCGAKLLLLSTPLLGLLGAVVVRAPAAAAERFPSQEAFSANHQWYVEVLRIEVPSAEPDPIAEEDGSLFDLDSNEDVPPAETQPVSLPIEEAQAKPEPPYLIVSLYAVGQRSRSVRVSTFRMAEERIPARLLVSNDGESVVVFFRRRWDGYPDGKDNIVLMRSDGSRVGSLSLSDLLTDGDLRQVGFADWESQLAWTSTDIDEVRGVLKLQLYRDLREEMTGEEGIATLEVDLATGRPLQPKRDLLPQARAILSDATDEASYTESSDRDDGNGCSTAWSAALASGRFAQRSNEELRAQVLLAPLPIYTELGRRARVTGLVVVELRIAANGEVESACLVKGLPMALDRSALDAVRHWRFRPFEVDGKPARAVGRLAFEFGWFLADRR